VLDRVGYLPEERGLYKKMTVRRVLRFLAALKSVPAAEADRRITMWLDRLALRTDERDWGDAKVDELSRGMQQKAQFIGALLHEPELVILDEPFSGLDPINAQALKDTVLDLKRQGRTVIFSTHIMDNAERMCDAVCIIAGGVKVLDGAVGEVKEAHRGAGHVALAFDVDGAGARVSAVFADRALVSRVDDLVQPSLHQIFLERVGATGVEAGMGGHG
jgi:ABC-2 type transport system ATP-binding protein